MTRNERETWKDLIIKTLVKALDNVSAWKIRQVEWWSKERFGKVGQSFIVILYAGMKNASYPYPENSGEILDRLFPFIFKNAPGPARRSKSLSEYYAPPY